MTRPSVCFLIYALMSPPIVDCSKRFADQRQTNGYRAERPVDRH